jgi:uncharacterized protein
MPYTILIRGVLDALADSLVVSDVIDVGEIRLGDDVFTPKGPAEFDVTLTNVGDGIMAVGQVRATVEATCVRCLCGFEMDVVGELDGFYVGAADEATLPDEQEREIIVDDRIDLEPVVVQSLVVDLPFAPVHASDCAGICASCGQDLNDGGCDCVPDGSDSPFARLKDAFPAEATEPGSDG